ncbi:MAG: hypothetical protein Q7N50_04050 [Armatimonadota bacterium]|nr:hypothetical protein [Armatimonadota bacterium]
MVQSFKKTVYTLLREKYGVDMDWREITDANDVDATDKIIARENPNRAALIVINTSTGTIYLRPRISATTSAGIVLVPSGGSMSISAPEDGPLAAYEWHAIGSAGNLAFLAIGGHLA